VDQAEPIGTNEMQLIYCSGNLLHSLIEHYCKYVQELIEDEKLQDFSVISDEIINDMIERLFLFSTIWA